MFFYYYNNYLYIYIEIDRIKKLYSYYYTKNIHYFLINCHKWVTEKIVNTEVQYCICGKEAAHHIFLSSSHNFSQYNSNIKSTIVYWYTIYLNLFIKLVAVVSH